MIDALPSPGTPDPVVVQPGALVAGAVGGLGLLIGAFRNLGAELKEEMRAGEERLNKRIDEVRQEMREVKEEMKELKTLLIQALQPSPAAKP